MRNYWMWRRGWDEAYGGIIYYRDVKGLPVTEYWQDIKFWWPQNEAIIATLMAYRMTGDEKVRPVASVGARLGSPLLSRSRIW